MLSKHITLFCKVLPILAFLSLQACQKEENVVTKSFPNIDKEFWAYFEKFEQEAANHGYEYDLINLGITAEIGETASSQWVGQCNHNTNQPNHIVINKMFWNAADNWRKEKIIFHELGHCVLGRGHDEDVLNNGYCKSIMRSGLGACLDNYTNDTDEYYINELFDF